MFDYALRPFLRDEKASIITTFTLAVVPVIALVGMGIEYSTGSMLNSRLDSIADSASLAAVTPAMLNQPDQASIESATTLFNGQASILQGVGPITLTVTPVDNGLQRTVTVSYSTARTTMFGGLIGASTMAISGTSQASAAVPPNIDFYLLLDNSPSMAIAERSTTMLYQFQNSGDDADSCRLRVGSSTKA
jgi:Flp pilus assembly protein TadG